MKSSSLIFILFFIISLVSAKVSFEVTNELKKSGKVNIVVLMKEEVNFESLFKGKENLDIDLKAKIIVDEVRNQKLNSKAKS